MCQECYTAAGGETEIHISEERHPLYHCPHCRADQKTFWTHISTPENLTRYLFPYDKLIRDTYNDVSLSKEEKKAKLQQFERDINFLKDNIMRYVTDDNKSAVNRIFDNYIGEHGSINDAIMGLEMGEARASEEKLELGDDKPVKTGTGDNLQPKTGSLARRE